MSILIYASATLFCGYFAGVVFPKFMRTLLFHVPLTFWYIRQNMMGKRVLLSLAQDLAVQALLSVGIFAALRLIDPQIEAFLLRSHFAIACWCVSLAIVAVQFTFEMDAVRDGYYEAFYVENIREEKRRAYEEVLSAIEGLGKEELARMQQSKQVPYPIQKAIRARQKQLGDANHSR